MKIEDIIRARVEAQNLHNPIHSNSSRQFIDVLEKSWWISGNYGLKSRIKSSMKTPMRIIQKNTSIKILLDNVTRIMAIPNYILLIKIFNEEYYDDELLNMLEEEGMIDKSSLANKLNISLRKLDYKIKHERQKFRLTVLNDKIWSNNHLFNKFNQVRVSNQLISDIEKDKLIDELIKSILKRYPLCNINQLSHLTQIEKYDLYKPLSKLTRDDQITRGLTITESPEELFMLMDHKNGEINWNEVPIFVLEKRDALVETIKLERGFDNGKGDYWIFIYGLPHAEFNLIKQKTNQYRIGELRLFITSTLDIPTILERIQEWSKSANIIIDNEIDSTQTILSKKLTSILINRGYQLSDNTLILSKIIKKTKSKSLRRVGLSWQDIGEWYRKKQYLTKTGDIQSVVRELIQIDELNSIAYRLKTPPNELDLSQLIFTYGVNYRQGLLSKEMLQSVVNAYPKTLNIKLADHKLIKFSGTLEEIASYLGRLKSDIQSRLLFLERIRAVRRDTRYRLDSESCRWIAFTDNISIDRGSGIKSNEDIALIITKLLEVHIPLTMDQISNFIGYSTRDLMEIKNYLLKKGELIEGYYLDFEPEVQLTVPQILDELEEIENENTDNIEDKPVDILPFSDTIAILHLKHLLLKYSELQPTERFNHDCEWWIILWRGEPVGYFIKIPSETTLIDYDISIKLRKRMDTIPVISGVIQEIVNILKLWHNDELKIVDINGISIDNNAFETLHFMLGTLGLR